MEHFMVIRQNNSHVYIFKTDPILLIFLKFDAALFSSFLFINSPPPPRCYVISKQSDRYTDGDQWLAGDLVSPQ